MRLAQYVGLLSLYAVEDPRVLCDYLPIFDKVGDPSSQRKILKCSCLSQKRHAQLYELFEWERFVKYFSLSKIDITRGRFG